MPPFVQHQINAPGIAISPVPEPEITLKRVRGWLSVYAAIGFAQNF